MTVYIKEIYIYGYGKFENFRITDIGLLKVIYGMNEAGKTTIMSFIHSILFGFPTRQQNELRYEPKNHAKYGGQLVLFDEEYGEVTIERVKGKASGDVTVTLAGGRRGGEELLTELLRGMDKATYQAIYSFNIHNLQEVHKLKGEDLNRYLFSASAVGSDRLLEAENLLKKEQDQLFRPYGKKPELNRQLEKLQEIDRRLTAARQNNDRYTELIREQERIERAINQLRKEVEQINHDIQAKSDWNRAYPYIKEKRELENELSTIGNPPFPRDGVRRLEQFENELIAVKERLTRRKEDAARLEEEMAAIKVRKDILMQEEAITTIIETLPAYRQEEEQRRQIESRLAGVREELDRFYDHLGFRLPEEKILSLNLGLAVKNRILHLERERDHLLRQKEELEKTERNLQTRLEHGEKFLRELQTRRITEEERCELENAIASSKEVEQLELERQWVDARWNEIKKKSARKARPLFPIVAFFLLFLIAIFYLFFVKAYELFILIFLFFLLMILFFFMFQRKNQHIYEEMEAELARRRDEIEKKLERMQGQQEKVDIAREKLDEDREFAQRIEIEQIQLRQLEEQFDVVIRNFSRWERDYKKVEEQILTLGETLALPNQLAKNHLLTGYELLVAMKEKIIELKKLANQLKEINNRLANREKALEELHFSFDLAGTNFPEKVNTLKIILDEEQKKQEKLRAKQEKHREFMAEIAEYREEQQIISAQMEQLLKEAEVKTKEEFYKQAEKVERRKEILERLQLLEEQIKRIPHQIPADERLEPVDESIFFELEQEKEKRTEEIEKLERIRASIIHEIQQIEEGGTYTELLHEYYQEKHRFNELAKEWAVYRLSAYILAKTTATYKKERLPELIERAAFLFQSITGGEYLNIHLEPEQDVFYVRRKDGMMFAPQELSQATQEQLYISIRLALVLAMNERIQLPILIDDGFVNFDEERLDQMIRVLKNAEQQVILFTCHRRIVEKFPEETILRLPVS